ncbi:HTH domain-containing protein [Gallibacter sp. Marseille-QA0791]|uniref:HTH domain-containing protein n=1 Tax=Gallibacter sp. Marseille-QA0791 TaxID=3378781 RepID=UPI003D1158AB
MGRGKLTQEEIKILKKNPNVISVNEDRIVYSDSFKKYFVEQYFMGEKPGNIFRSAGFDLKILGSKRIERASYRWRESFEAGTLGLYADTGMSHEAEMKDKELVQAEKDENDVAEEMNENRKLLWKTIEEQRAIITGLRSEVKRLQMINGKLMKELDRIH